MTAVEEERAATELERYWRVIRQQLDPTLYVQHRRTAHYDPRALNADQCPSTRASERVQKAGLS